MYNVDAGEIYKPRKHLEITWHWRGRGCTPLWNGRLIGRWNSEIIPPDPGLRELDRRGITACRVKDLGDLKRINVDVEGMGRSRAVIIYGPLFSRAEHHRLIDVAIELLAVDGV